MHDVENVLTTYFLLTILDYLRLSNLRFSRIRSMLKQHEGHILTERALFLRLEKNVLLF